MKTSPRFRMIRSECLLVAGLLLLATLVSAQSPGTGTLEGRVLNPASGEYLEMARITIEGTSLETFTDALGQYRLTNVPAGLLTVKVFRTGAAVRSQPVSISPGQVVQQDFELAASQLNPKAAHEPVVLSEFVVSTSKEMSGAAIAITHRGLRPTWSTSSPPTSSARCRAAMSARC